jgi:hypothetical protein
VFEGVPRETEKEKEMADFDIFDDPESPYSTFNFQYSNQAFTQLHDLMEFNTLNNIEVRSTFNCITTGSCTSISKCVRRSDRLWKSYID